jgi:hypothetical protein
VRFGGTKSFTEKNVGAWSFHQLAIASTGHFANKHKNSFFMRREEQSRLYYEPSKVKG